MSDQYDYERIANIEKLLDQIDKHRDGLEDRVEVLEAHAQRHTHPLPPMPDKVTRISIIALALVAGIALGRSL